MIIEGVRTTTTKPEQKTHIESKSHTDAHHPWGNTSTSEQRDSFPETDVTTESIYGLLSYATAGGETVSTTTATSIEHKTPLLSDPDAAGVPKVVGSYTDLKVLAKPIPWTAMDDKMKAHLKTKPFPDWDDTSKVTISESSVGTATYTCDYDEFTSSAADLSCYLHYEIPPGLTSDEIASLQPRDQIITKTIKNPAGEVIDTQITTIHLEPGKPSSVFNVSATDETDIPEGGSITLSLLPIEVNCPELYMFSGHKNDVVTLSKASGITCEWRLKNSSPAIGTFDHPADLACSFTATAPGKNTIQLVIGGKVAWEKPTEVLDIVGRATWGAYAADTSKLTTMPNLEGITIHHSSNTADGAAEVLRIQDMHMQKSLIYWSLPGDGWADISYNFLMDKAGTVYMGRELETAPGKLDGPYVQGAHVENNNKAAGIGICILGDYEGAEAFTAARQEALEKALSAIARRHKLTSEKVSYHQARATTNATECPGSNVIPKVPDIIKNVGRNLQ